MRQTVRGQIAHLCRPSTVAWSVASSGLAPGHPPSTPSKKEDDALHCKNIRTSTDILWRVFRILTEPVPFRRRLYPQIDGTVTRGPTLHSVKIWKTRRGYPSIYGYFYSVTGEEGRAVFGSGCGRWLMPARLASASSARARRTNGREADVSK